MPNDIANNITDTIHQLEKELKDLREENKVLIRECDRLIKEKGELLNKVSGGDVLRIRQLEEDRIMLNAQLTDLQLAYNEQMHELREAKQLLKLALPIINSSRRIDAITNPSTGKKELLKHYLLDEALKLIGGETDEHS